MPVLGKHVFNVQDYYQMARGGVLRADCRVELLDGEIIDMSPIGPFHAGITKFLIEYFNKAAKDRWILAVQDPLRVSDYSEPQPDLMLLKRVPDFYRGQHPSPGDVFLLIEIADTSLEYDRSRKLPAYGSAGIPEVWIVNLEEQSIELYREPHLTGYASKTILRSGAIATPLAFPDVAVLVAELMKK